MSSSGTSTGTGNDGYAGYLDATSDTSHFNTQAFLIEQILGLVRTASLVQVKSVTNSGGVSPVGTMSVLPLVNLLDGQGKSSSHGNINNVIYARLQGGANAIILDPQVGDIGIAVFADRDISSVKANKARANPGSWRCFDMADAVYLMTVLGASPTQYVQFSSTGINLTDLNGNTIVMNSAGVTINGVLIDRSHNVSGAGTVHASGEGTFNSHTVGGHQHAVAGVQTGISTVESATPTG